MTPLILACSPTVIHRPDDWPTSYIHIPGYLFLDRVAAYQPPSELTEFLDAGKPPICVTFGSTIHHDPEHIYRNVLQALKQTDNRAIILSGWSDLQNIRLLENIFVIDAVPHDWLLPHCKAIIHHGGAGTTAAGLRAGIPNILVPSAADQPFWGMQVHAIGASPKPIPIKELTAERVVVALAKIVDDAVQNTAQDIGRKIRIEDGVGETVKFIEKYSEKWHESVQSSTF